MRPFLPLLFGLCLLVGCASYTPIEMDGLVYEHNNIREEYKLNYLVVDERLNTAAQKHASYMAKRDQLSHYGKGGSRPSDRVEVEGYDYYMVAENIAAGYHSVDGVTRGWMESEGHRKNILGKFTHIGTAIAKSKSGRLYWCVLFATPSY